MTKVFMLIIWINSGSGSITNVGAYTTLERCESAGKMWQASGEVNGSGGYWNKYICLEKE